MAITSAIAREFAAKSVIARRANKAKREAAANTLLKAAEIIQAAEPAIAKPALSADSYLAERLIRVRKQLDLIDAMIEQERDPQRLDRLAAASAKLSEVCRQLEGRPLPGSYRPESPSSGRSIWSQPIGPACGVQPTTSSVPQNQQSTPTPQVSQATDSKPDSAAGK